MVNLFYPCDPYMTFEVKLLINFVAIYPTDYFDQVTLPCYVMCRGCSILKILKIWHILTFDPFTWGRMTRSPLTSTMVTKLRLLSIRWHNQFIGAVFIFFTWLTFLTHVTPTWPLRSNCWYNICSHLPIGHSDQVWSKFNQACIRRNKLWEEERGG